MDKILCLGFILFVILMYSAMVEMLQIAVKLHN